MMPTVDGLELCRQLRLQEATRTVPVLFLTAKDDLADKIKGFQAGGDDYITKPFIISELLARLQAHLRIQRLKRELALSEERYRLLIENSPDGILLLSPQLELLYHNNRFIEILKGQTQEPLTGRVLQTLFPISDLFCEISAIVERVKAAGGPAMKEAQITASNHRTVYLEVLGMPIRIRPDQVAMFQVVFRDITQRKRMEEALLQAEKINALGILTAGIAHEINNPLTGISNAIQILQRGNVARKRQDELFALVLDHIERIVRIVKDLRTFSQPHESTPALFSANEAVAEMVSLARYQVGRAKIDLETRPSPEPLFLFGDRHQFQQVILNLVVNAIQAIKETGKVTVSLQRQGGNVLITVEDTGMGIPANQMTRIFDPFFTTKRDWKGTGLGLAVAYRIVQLFKGTLTVQSTVGVGSRFMVTLPLHPPPPGGQGST
ncbi:MAG: sensor histidine kinase [Candidatus Ozemobacter sibiricus]|uniref:histidine kinase n=1 Tax=Candidatus Ozemobacter sibiricus TaxID=2268124 RepID=A0A367ZUE5_9BACT|nr:MAG: sensor histidine kinase [Candidatus Ozemobacter sibiricus]